MASYYSSASLPLVGTQTDLQCQHATIWTRNGDEVVACRGPVAFLWVHSGQGDFEAIACEAWVDRCRELGNLTVPRLHAPHAVYRDVTGTWQLRKDAEEHPAFRS